MNQTAKWITSPRDPGTSVVTFLHTFHPAKAVRKATLHASAMGIYALFLNGKRVGKGVLTPGWTSYKTRVQYQSYDVTTLLAADNRLEALVGQGWAVGYIGYANTNHYFADQIAFLAWMDVQYADGTREKLITDENWEVLTSLILSSEIYHGETVDHTAKIEKIGMAKETDISVKLIPQEGEWITEQERLAPVEILTTPKGERVIDFGQNMTGYVEVKINAPRGSRIVLHHAEVLDRDGNFYTANLRNARNENVYVCGGGEEIFKPTCSFQGFRYIQLVEYPFDTVNPDCFRAVVVQSELTRTGHYVCGNEKINQLYHNIIWGQKSNYLDIPTDCPQRDERLGWTGDAEVFFRTAAINFDVERFFRKWMGDVAIEQTKEGAVKGVVPACLKGQDSLISAAWGDVACVIPWFTYLIYGNKALLKKQYPIMKKWVGYMHGAGPEEFLWLGGYHYGDWLAMDGNPDECVGMTPTDFIASAFFAYSTSLLIRAGKALGEDVSGYETLYKNVKAAFRARFMKDGLPLLLPNGETDPAKITLPETQTAYVLVLYFGLYEESERQGIADRLAALIRAKGTRMTTGFVGTPYLLHVLSDNGYLGLAYELLMQEKSPSWLYSVCHGATTMWEHWNSLKEDGTFWSTSMNSFNHYAYGAVFDWIFGVSSGIEPTAPAYREIKLAPHPDKCLGFADASVDTRNGTVRSYWYYKGDAVYYEFDIPTGVTAHLTLPGGYTETLSAGSYRFTE